ncbi:hypothetical protein PG993_003376 [Apiospora rasikravindrae]|uniref:Uncharacterized protein n=1 Tax=Apiospora rasikravindrae TaxID=990691 RepID=A0ABR1TZC0_9PEZI
MRKKSQHFLVEEEQDEAATPRRVAPSNNGRIGNIVSNFAWRHARKKSKDSSSNSKDANEDFEDDADEVKAIIEQSSSRRRRPATATASAVTTPKGVQQRS